MPRQRPHWTWIFPTNTPPINQWWWYNRILGTNWSLTSRPDPNPMHGPTNKVVLCYQYHHASVCAGMNRNSGEMSRGRAQLDHQSEYKYRTVKHGLGRELMEARHPPCCPCAKENAAKRQKQNRQPFISIISHLQKGKGKGKGLAQRASGKSTRDDTNATFRFNIICHRRCSAGRQKK
jgi:hypothetical protein